MKIEKIKTGYLEENCYILKEKDECLIIDPGSDFFLIDEKIGNCKPKGILITHNHFDHIGAADEIVKKYNTNIYDKNNLKEEKIKICSFSFEVIYNPGHSSDSISFYFKSINTLFSGDFIFAGSIGRCDLETGNYSEMILSINKILKIFKNNKDLKIYPGHGEITTLKREIKTNPYLTNNM